MIAPTITGLYGALNAILNVFLANRVARARTKHGVGHGGSDSPEFLVASRTHSNNAEFVPLAILMMLIAELLGGASVVLHIFGGLLFTARVLHAVGMPRKAPNPFRFAGVAITWLAIVGISGWVLYLRTVA
jgi:uncharacterized membrane protein YecN with MAPEG domain